MKTMMRAIGLVAASYVCAGPMAAQLTPSPAQLLAVEERQQRSAVKKKKADRGLAENTPRWKRSRGAQAKPKKRRNLITHSRRIRRRHRRARKAA